MLFFIIVTEFKIEPTFTRGDCVHMSVLRHGERMREKSESVDVSHNKISFFM